MMPVSNTALEIRPDPSEPIKFTPSARLPAQLKNPAFRVKERKETIQSKIIPFDPLEVIALEDLYRYEFDIRKTKRKDGHKVLIRRRLKWTSRRYSRQTITTYCPTLTTKLVDHIRKGNITKAVINALEHGGIGNEIITKLCNRQGRGRGKRASELTDNERTLLFRFECTFTDNEASRNTHIGT